MLEIFTTRELAIATWALIVFLGCAIWKKTRKSIWDIIKSAFCNHFIKLYISLALYTALFVFIIYKVGFWDVFLLKDTIFSFVLIGLVSCFRIISNKDRVKFLKEIIVDAVKFAVIIEFITGSYTFDFYIEFISLFILFFIVAFSVIADREEKGKPVAKLCNFLITVYGLITIILSFSNAISDYNNLFTIETLQTFLWPIMMTIIYVPFIYVFAIHVLYEEVFNRLKVIIRNNKELFRYFKFRTRITFCFRLRKLEKFRTGASFTRELFKSKDDIDAFFAKINVKQEAGQNG